MQKASAINTCQGCNDTAMWGRGCALLTGGYGQSIHLTKHGNKPLAPIMGALSVGTIFGILSLTLGRSLRRLTGSAAKTLRNRGARITFFGKRHLLAGLPQKTEMNTHADGERQTYTTSKTKICAESTALALLSTTRSLRVKEAGVRYAGANRVTIITVLQSIIAMVPKKSAASFALDAIARLVRLRTEWTFSNGRLIICAVRESNY